MPVNNACAPIEDVRIELQNLAPPYLLRKYDVTSDDYEELANEDLRCEFLDGVLIVHSPASIQHEGGLSFLHVLLGHFIFERKLGRLFGSNAVMQLDQRRFCPDLSFLSAEHVDRIQNGRVYGPMDIAIESISNSTRAYDLGEKRLAYQQGRVPEIWFFDCDRRLAEIDFLEAGGYVTKSLTEGRFESRVLPGLSINVSWLWQDPPPNPLDVSTPGHDGSRAFSFGWPKTF
ncbi:MAG TPA: Uma2 family endonuclease [Phycisphaerae bacterium]|nr:Uma2 family endonuclease [Phycisphaerae bacterium]